MTTDYKVCLVPVTCKLLLDNCGIQRLFSAREIQSLRGDSKVRSLLRASGVQTLPGDTQSVCWWRSTHFSCFISTKLGAIRTHFGKQMNKETKLRIHNITAKAVFKFGSEAWVLKKREEQRLEAAQMTFLIPLFGVIKLDKEKNQCIIQNI